jgi:hypothetical protein
MTNGPSWHAGNSLKKRICQRCAPFYLIGISDSQFASHPCPMCPMRPSKGCKTARMWINPWLRRVRVGTCRISTVTVPQVSLVFRFRRIIYRMCGKGPPLSSVATGGNAVPTSPENGMSAGINDNFSASARDSLQGTFSGSEWCPI